MLSRIHYFDTFFYVISLRETCKTHTNLAISEWQSPSILIVNKIFMDGAMQINTVLVKYLICPHLDRWSLGMDELDFFPSEHQLGFKCSRVSLYKPFWKGQNRISPAVLKGEEVWTYISHVEVLLQLQILPPLAATFRLQSVECVICRDRNALLDFIGAHNVWP